MRDWILIRHGQSEDNAGIVRHPNSRLTAKGVEQCISAAARLTDAVTQDYRVVTSPYLRTAETSSIICGRLNLSTGFDAGFREFAESCQVGGVHFPQETHREFFVRIFRAIVKRAESERYLIVTHGGVIATLSQILVDKQPDAARWQGVENCEIRRFQVADNTIAWVKKNLDEIDGK